MKLLRVSKLREDAKLEEEEIPMVNLASDIIAKTMGKKLESLLISKTGGSVTLVFEGGEKLKFSGKFSGMGVYLNL